MDSLDHGLNLRLILFSVQHFLLYYPTSQWLASLIAQLVKNLPGIQETWVRFLGQEAPGEGTGNPLQHSCLENPNGQRRLAGYSPRGRKSRTRLSDQTTTTTIAFQSPAIWFNLDRETKVRTQSSELLVFQYKYIKTGILCIKIKNFCALRDT